MRSRCIRTLLATAMVGCALTAHGQQIYKWVDDKGVTHYTTTPPPGGKAQAIRAQPAAGKSPPEMKSWKDQEIEFRARQVERAEAQHKEERAQRDAAQRRAACAAAQRDLSNLKEQVPVYRFDEKGERQYLDEAQRADAERKTRNFVDQECSK